jgi:hypothetical protein
VQVAEDVTEALARLAPYSFLVCFSASIPGCLRVGVHLGDGQVEYVRIGVSVREGGAEPIRYSFAGQRAGWLAAPAPAPNRQGADNKCWGLLLLLSDPLGRPATPSIAELLRRVYETGPQEAFRAGDMTGRRGDLEAPGDRYGVKYHPRSAIVPAPEVIDDDDDDDDVDDDDGQVRLPPSGG